MDGLSQYSTSPNSYKAYLRAQGQQELSQLPHLQTPQTNVQPLIPNMQPMLAQQQQQAPDSAQMTGGQASILNKPVSLTQKFGNMNPADEVFSKGINSGADFGAASGTQLALPPTGKWKILESYAADKTPGHIGDNTNRGYGNSVLAQNEQTGEKLRFSHLSQNNAQAGQELNGGTVLGQTGQTGNASGPHLDLEYYDKNGKLGDVLGSLYAKYLQITGQDGGGPQGGGNPGAGRFKTMGMHPDDVEEVNKMYALFKLNPDQVRPDKFAPFENMVNGLASTYLDKPKELRHMSLTDKLEALYRRGQEDTQENAPYVGMAQ